MSTYTSFYRGIEIERRWPSGMYTAFIVGFGYLRADTLAGIRYLIKEALREVAR